MANFKRTGCSSSTEIFHSKKEKISLDTHFYDGKLLERTKDLEKLDEKTLVDMFREFSKVINSRYFLRIKSDHCSVSRDNYDPTNNVDAANILGHIYLKYRESSDETKKDILDLLKTQFEEMSSGPCSQGRCTRLLQVLFCLF